MIAVADYGAGNLGSVVKALRHVGAEVCIARDAAEAEASSGLVVPGVGAFARCVDGLAAAGLTDAVREYVRSGRPFLGICVGMQMLFDHSEEMGRTPGLGVLPGRVRKFAFGDRSDLKIPHIGWNNVDPCSSAPPILGAQAGESFYFVHSYHADPDETSDVAGVTEYGYRFCSAVRRGNVFGVQFHPEKSGTAGLAILRNFAALAS